MNRQEFDSVHTRARTSELEKLLDVAEDLNEKCERESRGIERARLAQFALFVTLAIPILAAIFGGYSLWWINSSPSVVSVLVTSFSILGFLYIGFIELLTRRRLARMNPDRLALSEIIQLIRETESAISESEHWSTLERAQFRIRLSRFGIGPRSY